jgi:uncharacterized protein (DUF302 family)
MRIGQVGLGQKMGDLAGKAGTQLMVASPLLAFDLPLKALVWEDQEKKVWVSYNTPEYLTQRHGLPADSPQNIAGVEGLIKLALG